MNSRRISLLWMSAMCLVALAGCVQSPTERRSVVDLRPEVSFRVESSSGQILEARVMVDGLDSGRVGDFLDGRGALRVLQGTHTIRVVNGSAILLEERVYLGDGVSRPFTLK